MIVRAALPLLADHGSAVTTSQIARAAGIGEATIFRAFADKEELMEACVHEALRPDHALAAIAEIPLTDPLPVRLAEAAGAMSAHLERMGRVVGALHTSGHQHRRPDHKDNKDGAGRSGHHPVLSREESFARTRAALTELFEPERDELRLPPERLATVFLTVMFSRSRSFSGDDPVDVDTLIDLFLHGALADAAA